MSKTKQSLTQDNLLCIFCEHYYVRTAEPDYSEWTPGTQFTMLCLKGKWEVDPWKDNTSTYRKMLLTAHTCNDYELTEDYNEIMSTADDY